MFLNLVSKIHVIKDFLGGYDVKYHDDKFFVS